MNGRPRPVGRGGANLGATDTVVDLRAARGRAARRRALAFAEITLAVFLAVEHHVRLPRPALPDLDVPTHPTPQEVAELAHQARRHLGVPAGPVPNMVRLLEAHGVAVVRFDRHDLEPDGFEPGTAGDGDEHSRTFSHLGYRPVVLLDPAGQDKARSRFDAARELGQLLLHRPTGAGLRRAGSGPAAGGAMAQERTRLFATEFLAPTPELAGELVPELPSPRRGEGPALDGLTLPALHELKRRWGMNLGELLERAHTLGRIGADECRAARAQIERPGRPEPGPLGALEAPVLLPRAFDLLAGRGPGGLPDADLVLTLSGEAGLPPDVVQHVVRAAGVVPLGAALALERHG
jgi:Zn-dependent peptidase ImmA (M78 family)